MNGRERAETASMLDGDKCRFYPESYETVFDDNDEEIETDEPAEDCCWFICSNCGYPMMYGDDGWFDFDPPYRARFNYCPNCGKEVDHGDK